MKIYHFGHFSDKKYPERGHPKTMNGLLQRSAVDKTHNKLVLRTARTQSKGSNYCRHNDAQIGHDHMYKHTAVLHNCSNNWAA